MYSQFFPCPQKNHLHLTFADAIILRNFFHRAEIPVPPQKDFTMLRFQTAQESVQRIPDGDILAHISVAAWNAFLQFFQRKENTAVPLPGMIPAPTVQGEIPGDPSEKGLQYLWSLGRYRIPCPKVCIIDTFISILCVVQYVPGDPAAVSSVFTCCLGYGFFRPCSVQVDDSVIFHMSAPSKGLSPLYTQSKVCWSQVIWKIIS